LAGEQHNRGGRQFNFNLFNINFQGTPPKPPRRAVVSVALALVSLVAGGGLKGIEWLSNAHGPATMGFIRDNCVELGSQAQAQAQLRAQPNDPSGIDRDRDGIACENNRAPRDLTPVVR
jgi:hypothetical protein